MWSKLHNLLLVSLCARGPDTFETLDVLSLSVLVDPQDRGSQDLMYSWETSTCCLSAPTYPLFDLISGYCFSIHTHRHCSIMQIHPLQAFMTDVEYLS